MRVVVCMSVAVNGKVVLDFYSGNEDEGVIDGMVVGHFDVYEIARNGTGTSLLWLWSS